MSEKRVPFQFTERPAEMPTPQVTPQQGILRPETAEQLRSLAAAMGAQAKENTAPPPAPVAPAPPPDDDDLAYDFGRSREFLEDPELRKAIEGRCRPMTLDELLAEGRSTQRVPIVPGKFEATFTTTSGEEDFFVKRALDKERGGDLYLHQMMTLMNLTMGLVAVNDTKFGPVLLPTGVDEKAFEAKFKAIRAYPVPMLLSLQINYFWFFERAKKLFSFR